MSEEAVLDAPILDAIEPVVDETPAAETDVTPEPTAPSEEVKGDERVLPQWIRNLKTTDPAAFKEAKGIFFGKRSIDEKLKDFDLDGTRSWLDEVGGRESIVEKLASLETSSVELQQINEAIKSGNTDLVREIAEVAPEHFPAMARAAVEQWAQVDPDGWQHAMSQVMAATISNSGIPAFIDRMEMMLKYNDTAGFGESLAQLKQWASSFSQLASKAPERQQPRQNDALSQREQQIAQREEQIFTQDVQRDVESFRTPLIEAELKDFIALKPNDADAKQMAEEKIVAEVVKRLKADTDFQKKADALWSARNKEGFMRLVKSRETTAIKDIAPKVGRTIFGSPASAKPAPKPASPGPRAVPDRTQPRTDPRDAVLQRILSR